MEWVQDLAHPNRLPSDRKIAVFLIDDMLEHLGEKLPSSLRVTFAGILSANALDPDCSLRQAAVFGLGTWGIKCGVSGVDANVLQEIYGKIVGAIKFPFKDAQEKVQGGMAYDNAVSSLGKLLSVLTPNHGVDIAAGYDLFVSNLPLRNDMEESNVAIRLLCDAFASRKQVLLPMADRIMLVLSEVIGTPMSAESDQQIIIATLEMLQAALPQATVNLMWSNQVDEKQRSNIMRIAAKVRAAE